MAGVVWWSKTDDIGLVASCGKWKAELIRDEPYTPGLLCIGYENKNRDKKVDGRLGRKEIPDKDQLLTLVDKISIGMLDKPICTIQGNCQCKNVYLLSLNENNNTHAMHFRLWPRYDHDQHILELVDETGEQADALALMAERRRQFLRKNQTNVWGKDSWPRPYNKYPKDWAKYAKAIKQRLIKATGN